MLLLDMTAVGHVCLMDRICGCLIVCMLSDRLSTLERGVTSRWVRAPPVIVQEAGAYPRTVRQPCSS